MSRPLTVGTAGHVDHGKTALVRALTGRDTDRLPEERRRGISIDLGFAPLDLGERRLSLIDVPGHERFVRTMIAGATGIDLFLMVIAVDDGVMPQTREHLMVLGALGVDHGVVALTKCDLADDDARMLVANQARELVPAAPIVHVSAAAGIGIDELRDALLAVAKQVERERPTPQGAGDAVLHIDRVFTIAGHGTVVTGTLWSGSVSRGDQLKIWPAGAVTRVREVQVHDQAVACAEAHQRVAVNLVGVKRREVARGDVLASAGADLAPTYRLDAELRLVGEVQERERMQVHHGTREVAGTLVRLADGLAQLRLEAPLFAAAGDRFVLRRIAPPDTLGGGRVLDAHPRRHGPGLAVDRLRRIQAGPLDPETATASKRKNVADPRPREESSVSPTVTPEALRALDVLRSDGAMPRSTSALAESLGVVDSVALAALDGLTSIGEVVRVKPDIYYPCGELARLQGKVVDLIHARGSVTLSEARDALGLSRRYTQALLEHLDARRVTIRHGEHRVLRRPRAQQALDADQ